MIRRVLRRLRARRRALALAAAALAAVLAAVVAFELGWLGRARPWQAATGWDRIPGELRPLDGPAWTPRGPDDEPPSVAWLGHSGFVLRWKGATILLDPNTSRRCTVTRRVLEDAGDVEALGHVDAVLVSHAHFDHLDLPTLARLRDVDRIALPAGAERALGGLPVGAAVDPVVPGECLDVGRLRACAVAAHHEGNRLHPFRGRVGAVGWVVSSGTDALYYAGDTAPTLPFEDVRERFHPRLAILPIGAWRPRFPMRYYHLSPEEAAQAALRLGVETVIPCHFGTFRVSLDRPASALPRFAAAARASGVSWRMPRLLRAGEEAP